MAIIVEDGTIVPNANSYNSDADYTAYALARGITIGADAAAREIELIRATDYVDNELTRMQSKTEPANQSLRYPQIGSYANGVLVGKNTIPQELKRAQLEAAISVFKGDFDIVPTAKNIKSEQLANLKTEYFEGVNIEPKSQSADVYLDMLSPTVGGTMFSVVRG